MRLRELLDSPFVAPLPESTPLTLPFSPVPILTLGQLRRMLAYLEGVASCKNCNYPDVEKAITLQNLANNTTDLLRDL